MAKFMTEIRGEAPEEYTFFNDEQKLKVQKIVDTHYQKSLTGIHYIDIYLVLAIYTLSDVYTTKT